MDKLDVGDDWDQWGEPTAEELKSDLPFGNFGEPNDEKEVTMRPLEIGQDVKDKISNIMAQNQKYLKEVANFNAKPKQCFTAGRYPDGFKLTTY